MFTYFYHLEERLFQTSLSISQVFDQKKNIIQHIQKAYANHRDWSCDDPTSFRLQSCCFFRGPRSARGSHRTSSFLFSWSFGDVQPIQAGVDLDFSFTRWGSQHLSFHSVSMKKHRFRQQKSNSWWYILRRFSWAIKHDSTLASESFAGLFRVKASQRTSDVITWLQIFHLQ